MLTTNLCSTSLVSCSLLENDMDYALLCNLSHLSVFLEGILNNPFFGVGWPAYVNYQHTCTHIIVLLYKTDCSEFK